jgi:DNA polymerase-4
VFVRSDATIMHADLDAFYASVEQRDDPRLRGRPVIVGGGVVLAASYEAKAHGVRTAMSGRQARRLCPDAVVVEPRMSAYAAASKAVFAVFEQTTPLVEGISIDEAFLEVGGLWRIAGPPLDIAVRLRREVLEQVGLPITVGIARTKFLAKVASGVAKPDGLLLVPPGGEPAFLHPLPVERLWGVGTVTADKLHAFGVRTVGEVASSARRRWCRSSALPSDGICMRWRTTATRGPSTPVVGAARSGRNGRSAAGRAPRRSWT